MIKKPLWIGEDMQRKFLTAKALMGCVNVEQVLIRLGIVEQLNNLITDSLKMQSEATKRLLKSKNKIRGDTSL